MLELGFNVIIKAVNLFKNSFEFDQPLHRLSALPPSAPRHPRSPRPERGQHRRERLRRRRGMRSPDPRPRRWR